MSIPTNRPCYVDPYYIAGLNSHPAENFSDKSLSFPAAFWGGKTVEVLQRDNTLEVDYIERDGCNQIFSNAISCVEANALDACMLPTIVCLGAGALITYIATLPFELLGQCMKKCVLNTNWAAKAYNDLAARHLQAVHGIETYSTLLQNKLESETFISDLYKALLKPKYRLSIPTTRIVYVQTIPVEVLISPIFDKIAVVDYEISTLSTSRVGLPVCFSILARKIRRQEIKIQELQKQLDEKIQLLTAEKETFKENVTAFFNEENEKTYLLT